MWNAMTWALESRRTCPWCVLASSEALNSSCSMLINGRGQHIASKDLQGAVALRIDCLDAFGPLSETEGFAAISVQIVSSFEGPCSSEGRCHVAASVAQAIELVSNIDSESTDKERM